jgi:GNAT superfamily N-acetyltransferase
MAGCVVRPVQSWRQRREFLELPWSIYRDDPRWIPPLRIDQKELVGYAKHPFYEENETQTFLAYRSGEVCGRIAAILNRGHNSQHNEQRGFFGFFECREDEDAARGLFDAARQWFADRGITQLRGPTNPSQNYTVGLLVEGFDSPPFFMMTYNPPYYARLIERCGFTKSQDLYSFWGHIGMLPAIQAKLAPIAEQIMQHIDVRLRPMDTKRFREDVEEFLSIYNRSLMHTWGFVPMTEHEVQHTARGLRYLIVPELAVAAEMDGKMVGAAFALPDYNTRIREIDGRLFPFGFWRLLRRKHEIKRIRVLSTNVLPEYHRQGVGLVLMHGLVPKAIEWGIEEAEFSWVLESNSLSRRSLEKGGAKRTKTYRVYDSV